MLPKMSGDARISPCALHDACGQLRRLDENRVDQRGRIADQKSRRDRPVMAHDITRLCRCRGARQVNECCEGKNSHRNAEHFLRRRCADRDPPKLQREPSRDEGNRAEDNVEARNCSQRARELMWLTELALVPPPALYRQNDSQRDQINHNELVRPQAKPDDKPGCDQHALCFLVSPVLALSAIQQKQSCPIT